MGFDGVSRDALTYVFTDIVGSTELWEHEPSRMGAAVQASEELQHRHIEAFRGRVFKHAGNGLGATFTVPSDAVLAAGAIQIDIVGREWRDGGLPLRIGMNTGEAEARVGDYFGSPVNLAARIMSVAQGGQVLISSVTAATARPQLAPEYSLDDVGEAWLRGFEHAHRLVQLGHRELRSDFPRLAQRSDVDRSLPTPTTTLVDRVEEMASVMGTLERGRIVTLVGPPGVGKSRLALEVARRAFDRWSHGSVWCSLEEATSAEQALHVIAAAIDVSDLGGDPIEDIVVHLAHREVLVVLDNVEHLVEPVRDLVNEMILHCANVALLATSQEPLRISGEVVCVVEPLACGRTGAGPAEMLFIDRAQSTGGQLGGSEENAHRISELCARLDGIPLAIELAAARVRSMTLAEMETALDQRFKLLTTRDHGRARPSRHQTLYRAMEWSYELLDVRGRAMFELLGVFSGGAHLDAVEFVAEHSEVDVGDAGETLWELVEKSLVRTDTSGETTRFTMLASLHAFALDRHVAHGTLMVAERSHAAFYLSFAETAERERSGPDERWWVDAQLREFDNLRSAVAYSLASGDIDTALRIFVAMYEIASMQGRVEVFDWVDPSTLLDSGHVLVPAALAMSGLRHDPLMPSSLDAAEEAIRTFAEDGGRMHRILPFARGFAEASRQHHGAALAAYEDAARVVAETEGRNGRWITARCLVHMFAPDTAAAETLVADARRVGQPTGIAFSYLVLARALRDSRPEEALRLTEAAAELSATVDNRHVSVYVDLTRAGVLAHGARPEGALEFLLRALVSAVELGQHEVMWRSVGDIAAVLQRLGDDDHAVELLQMWVGHYPGGPEAAERRFSVTVSSVDALGDAASFDELLAHTRDIVASVCAASTNPATGAPSGTSSDTSSDNSSSDDWTGPLAGALSGAPRDEAVPPA
ncbi:adenylate/guanylate cyclase domain-containing protein [Ilumatobacter sp.]|uniref:adenylate/guanylate cyclase domain-containing protein n=1 Tax=Ilumatobacter sp. TaxID=1967498 RepID=UPI003C64E0DD